MTISFICFDWILFILNADPKIWKNWPKHIKCSKTLGQFFKKMYRSLTHEYPSSTFGVETCFLTIRMVNQM